MGTQARLTPVIALLSLLAVACGDTGDETPLPAQPKATPRIADKTTPEQPPPTADVAMGPGFAVLGNDDPVTTPPGGPEMPPDFDLEALLRKARRAEVPELTGPEPAELPGQQTGYLVGVIRMRGQTAFLKLKGTSVQLASAGIALRRACQSFQLVSGELQWTVPVGLNAKFGGEGSMVPAALGLKADPSVNGTLTLLSGDGGGLAASVLGWLSNLERPVPTDDVLRAFLRRQERFLSSGGLDVVIIDLSGAIE